MTARKTPGRRRKTRKTTTSAAIAVAVVLTTSSSTTVCGFAVPPRLRFPASSSSSSSSSSDPSAAPDDCDYDDDARERYLRLAGEAYVRYYSPDAMPASASASALVNAPSREEYLRLAMDAWERAVSSSSRTPSEGEDNEEEEKEKEKKEDAEDASTPPPPFFAYSTPSSTTTSTNTSGEDGGVVVVVGGGGGGGGDDPTADGEGRRTGVVNDEDVDGGGDGVAFLDAARDILSSMTTALFGGVGGIGDGPAVVRDGGVGPRDAAASAVRDVEEEEEDDESVPYGLRPRQRARPRSSSSPSSTPALAENETNDESIGVGVGVGVGVEMKKTMTTTTVAAAEKRPIEPNILGRMRAKDVVGDDAAIALKASRANTMAETATATGKSVGSEAKSPPRFSPTTRSVSITEGLTAEEAERTQNLRLDDADAFRLGRLRSATDISRPKNYIPLTEGLTAEEAEGVRNARLDDAGRSRSATDIPRSETYLPLTEGLTAEEAEGVRNARLADAGRSRSATDIPLSETYLPLTEGLTAEEAEGVRNARLDDTGLPRSVTDIPLSETYLPLTEDLTAEEAERVRNARLDDADAFVKSQKRTASSPIPKITTTTAKTVGKAGTRAVASPASVAMVPVPPLVSLTVLAPDNNDTRMTAIDSSENEMNGDVALSSSKSLSQTTSAFVGTEEGGQERLDEEARLMTEQIEQERLATLIERERILAAYSTPSSTTTSTKTSREDGGVVGGGNGGGGDDPTADGEGRRTGVVNDEDVNGGGNGVAFLDAARDILSSMTTALFGGGGIGDSPAVVRDGGGPRDAAASAVRDVEEEDDDEEESLPYELRSRRWAQWRSASMRPSSTSAENKTDDESIGLRIGVDMGTTTTVAAAEKRPIEPNILGRMRAKDVVGDDAAIALKGDTASSIILKSIAATSAERSVGEGGARGVFPTPLKGKESASPMDRKRSIIGGGGNFLAGLKKTIGVASDGIEKGVIGKDFPSLLKSSSSLKRDGDVFEQADDGSAAPTANEAIDSSIISPLSTPDNLKGAEVFAGGGMKTPNMAGPLKKNTFLASLSKGKGFGETISKDNSNAETPTTTLSLESLSKRNLGALKGKSDNSSTTLKKSFFESLSRGELGGMKSKGGPLPLPPPLKGMQISSGTNAGTGLPFMKKSIISNKDGDEPGTASTTPNIVGKSGPGFVERGPLPFLKKSLFNSNPAMGNELLDDDEFQSKINSFGGSFPTPLKRGVSMDTKSSGGSFLAGLKKSGGALNDGNVSMKGIVFDGMKRTGGTLPPPPPPPLKGMQVSRPGVGKELLFKKQSVTTENVFDIQIGAKSSDKKAMTVPATEILTIGFQQPLNVRLQGAAPIENIRVESVTEGTPDELKYSSERDVFTDNNDIVSNDIINSEASIGEEEQERLNEEAQLMTEQLEQERLAAYIEQKRITAEQKQILEAARLEQERLAAEADHLRQEIERLKQDNLAEAARLKAERMEHERLSALIEQERSSAKQMQRDKEAAWLEEEKVVQEEPERSRQAIMMDLTGNEISEYYDGDVTSLPSSQTMSMFGPEEDEGITSLTTMSLADAKEEPSWRISFSILGDGVMVEDALTFPLLHIGNRIQSSAYGTTHECFLFQSIEAGGGNSNRDNVAAKVFDDGNNRFSIMPCIAKRPWSMPELNATVPAQVLALERQQRYYDAIEEDTRQSMPEPWELDDKAAKIRRHYETEIHIFQKFERRREFLSEQRRRIRQQEEAERERGSAKIIGDPSIDGVEAGNLIAVPKFLGVYPDDGSGGPNSDDAISEYGATGADVWGKSLSDLGGSHEWLVYEGRFESVVTLLDAMEMKDLYKNDGVYHHLCGIQRAMNLPETYDFGDVLDVICRSLLEDLVFLSSCNVVHRDLRPGNILCDSENKRLRLANFGNALDLDPPRVGLENDSLELDAPGSIANTLAADVYSVAFIICRLLFDVPDDVLNQQLTGAGFDLDLWFQQTLAAAGSNLMGFSDALNYLSERRGLWGLLKTAIRPNPLRKKITADSLRQFNEVLELKNGNIKWTEERVQKIAREESYLEYVLNLAFGNVGGLPFTIETTAEAGRDSKYEIPSPSYRDEDGFDITRVPYTLQPRTKASVSVLSKLSKEADQSSPRFKPSDEFATNTPLVSESGDYTDITRLKFTPMRKSLLTDMLVSYANKRPASNFQQQRMEASSRENYYDTTAYFGNISPQRSEQNAFEAVIQSSYITPGGRPSADSMEIVQIFAPAGKLGVEVDTPESGGPAYVSSISDNSPLLGRIFLGDRIVAVDNMDVQSLVADDVSKILLVKSTNTRRLISILRNNFEGVGRPLYPPNGCAGAQAQAALANDKRFEEVEQWLMSYLPQLNKEDAVNYCKCLIDDGFDSLDMLAELLDDDIYFMKKAHKRVMSRKLSNMAAPDEQILPARKVYTVDEALGVAARKGIEATIAEEKRLASEARPVANKAKVGQKNKADKKPIVVSEARSKVKEEEWLRKYAAKKAEVERNMKGNGGSRPK